MNIIFYFEKGTYWNWLTFVAAGFLILALFLFFPRI
jgi:hypothetical protein